MKTTRAPEFIDITDRVIEAVGESEVDAGIAVVFSRHTTAAIKINENEPLLIKDMEHFLGTVAPQDAYYGHNDFAIRTVHMHEDECPNGHAHCQHLTLGSSEMIPIIDGELAFGKWQRVFLVELDLPKQREVVVQIMGE
ncbi:MAG: YjbQ family protein [Chloroflexi bacterium]|nr:YjbQ family protein [Chloroflexota bacterium]MBT4074157.1 YjbQ family protein [Chloroflexota bacterium]MBT4513598.1 YjbQ family protein [Chloroflexota bacterium]MBT6680694.1 YjbQ family protein [Chloroflexota bacterium]